MAVPKKRTSKSKSKIRKNCWKRKGYKQAIKALKIATFWLNKKIN